MKIKEKKLDAFEKNNKLNDDKAGSKALFKDGLKEFIQSYPDFFSTPVKNELKRLATSEENIDYEKLSQEILFDDLTFFKRYNKLYILLKNLMAGKIGTNIVSNDQRDFVFDLMKG